MLKKWEVTGHRTDDQRHYAPFSVGSTPPPTGTPGRGSRPRQRALDLDSRTIRQQPAAALTEAGWFAEAERHYRILLRKKRR